MLRFNKSHKSLKGNNNAFTIIELLIATTVSSVIILGASMMIIQITRMYYKSIIMSNTQTSARDLMESITRPIQYEGAAIEGPAPLGSGKYKLCIGNVRFTYQINKQQGVDINHAVWKDKAPCSAGEIDLSSPSTGQDVLSKNMRLLSLVVEPVTNASGLYRVEVKVAYGDSDLFDDPDNPTVCKGNIAGGQWCSIVSYKTMIFKRLSP